MPGGSVPTSLRTSMNGYPSKNIAYDPWRQIMNVTRQRDLNTSLVNIIDMVLTCFIATKHVCFECPVTMTLIKT